MQKEKRKRRRNKGLAVRVKHHRPGQRYRHQRILGTGRSENPIHCLSGHSSFTSAAYAESKLLPSDATVQEFVATPGLFIRLCLGSEVVNQAPEPDIVDLTTLQERMLHRTAEKLKDMIAYFFVKLHECPPQEKWGGTNGTASQICRALKLEGKTKRRFVKKVMRDVSEHISKGKVYSGKRHYSTWSDSKLLIPPDSDEYQIIGDSMEDGHRLIATTELVNEFRCVNI